MRLALLALLLVGAAPQDPPARPNVVVIMADDFDVRLLETALTMNLMPHLKRVFVDEGLRFSNCFATNAVCAPSRATFLTGQYSRHHGVRHNGLGLAALDGSNTLPVWLREAGVRTGHVGKYLNGYGYQVPPESVPPGWDDWQGLVDLSTYRVYDYWINDNKTLVHYDERPENYQTDVLSRRAVDFIQESAGGPFFLSLNPLPPHVEIDGTEEISWKGAFSWTVRPAPRHAGSTDALALPRVPSFNELDVRDKPAWLRLKPLLDAPMLQGLTAQYRDRAASLRAVDDMIGAVVAALQKAGVYDRTALFFTADNGFHHGEHRLVEKLYAFEESIRVPLLARLPGMSAPRVVREMVLNTDLAPTICALTGATPRRRVDGRSLVPLLTGSPAAWRRRGLVEHYMSSPTPGQLEVPTYSALRTADDAPSLPGRLYAEYRQGEWGTKEHYDLNVDPFQLLSLHGAPARDAERDALALSLYLLRTAAPGDAARFEN
ncbi:MAG TPA: sulfatase [Planctomycetota bacterium]